MSAKLLKNSKNLPESLSDKLYGNLLDKRRKIRQKTSKRVCIICLSEAEHFDKHRFNLKFF